jgi:Co/Zn/Cd efflux system component
VRTAGNECKTDPVMEDRAAGIYIWLMSASCCLDFHEDDPQRGNAAYRRVLWIVLAINAVMFAVEIGAGLAAGSASLQADALDFLGDAGNYAISLFVVGMALRYRALAALVKGSTMAVFGLWVVGITGWHAWHGTLPQALTMGAVGFTALAANAASFGLLWSHRGATPTCARRGFARAMMSSGIWPCCWPHWACSALAQDGLTCWWRRHRHR